MKNNKNVSRYVFGRGAIDQLGDILSIRRRQESRPALFMIDHFFERQGLTDRLPFTVDDRVVYVDTTDEPKTSYVNALYGMLNSPEAGPPAAVIGIGGGATLDAAKAISNLFTNGGKAEDYQGWDLVKVPGIYKVGIPTLSGTGAESSRTCVMTNPANGLKLGMNSDYTIYDQLILDPELSRTAPRNQFFYTGIDTYIHCFESLGGAYRNPIGDSFSREALNLSREVFCSEDMMQDANREKLMVASYLGGCAIAHSYVGLVHPFSAGLSVILGLHHGVANCIALCALDSYYPEAAEEMRQMINLQGIRIPSGVCSDLPKDRFDALYRSTIIHERPLANALGEDFKAHLTRDKVCEIFGRM